MQVNRRNFLGLVAAAMTVSTAGPTMALVPQPTKFQVALSLFDETVAARHDLELLHINFDRTFAYMFANFEPPTDDAETQQAVSLLLDGRTKDGVYLHENEPSLEALLRAIPSPIMEKMWPIAIAKLMFRDYQLPLNHRKLVTFKQFHDTYALLIISV